SEGDAHGSRSRQHTEATHLHRLLHPSPARPGDHSDLLHPLHGHRDRQAGDHRHCGPVGRDPHPAADHDHLQLDHDDHDDHAAADPDERRVGNDHNAPAAHHHHHHHHHDHHDDHAHDHDHHHHHDDNHHDYPDHEDHNNHYHEHQA